MTALEYGPDDVGPDGAIILRSPAWRWAHVGTVVAIVAADATQPADAVVEAHTGTGAPLVRPIGQTGP